MGKKSLESLTETMFYVLMAFRKQALCGTEVADFVSRKTKGRVNMGPGTLYTILGKFQEEGFLTERTYQLTESGEKRYQEEVARLRACVADAESEEERP